MFCFCFTWYVIAYLIHSGLACLFMHQAITTTFMIRYCEVGAIGRNKLYWNRNITIFNHENAFKISSTKCRPLYWGLNVVSSTSLSGKGNIWSQYHACWCPGDAPCVARTSTSMVLIILFSQSIAFPQGEQGQHISCSKERRKVQRNINIYFFIEIILTSQGVIHNNQMSAFLFSYDGEKEYSQMHELFDCRSVSTFHNGLL